MKTFVLVATLALIAVPASAQGMMGGKHHHGGGETKTAAKPKANDAAFKNALTNLPNKQYDPWGEVRPPADAGGRKAGH